ncbi:hypothetical protein RchiOBHm_Chr2g0097281 [Rosa chinensis]|uniref:Uncharacterized protein n=1 Tax=Rosa chinensis TaxID=74649 RepID=A0A2P6RLB3_ROSCH|nr:hypothetical protein RchiOBHm_Chr2g0097281 [Rosa chinensis]
MVSPAINDTHPWEQHHTKLHLYKLDQLRTELNTFFQPLPHFLSVTRIACKVEGVSQCSDLIFPPW